MADQNLLTRLDLALSQVKRVEREARIAKQMLRGAQKAASANLEPMEGQKDDKAEQDQQGHLEEA